MTYTFNVGPHTLRLDGRVYHIILSWVECSSMFWETGVQSQVESYQRSPSTEQKKYTNRLQVYGNALYAPMQLCKKKRRKNK